MGLREEKKKKTRKMILDQSLTLFGEKGVGNVGMRELAASCNLGIGTYYNYFKSKDEVIISLIEQKLERYLNRDVKILSVVEDLEKDKFVYQAFLPIALNLENYVFLNTIISSLQNSCLKNFTKEQALYRFVAISHFCLLHENRIDRESFISGHP